MPFRKTPWPWPSRDANFDASPKLVIIREPAVQTHRPGSSLQRICRTTSIIIYLHFMYWEVPSLFHHNGWTCPSCWISFSCQPLLCLTGQVAPKKSSLQPAIIWSNLGGVDGANHPRWLFSVYWMLPNGRTYGQTPHSDSFRPSAKLGDLWLGHPQP